MTAFGFGELEGIRFFINFQPPADLLLHIYIYIYTYIYDHIIHNDDAHHLTKWGGSTPYKTFSGTPPKGSAPKGSGHHFIETGVSDAASAVFFEAT